MNFTKDEMTLFLQQRGYSVQTRDYRDRERHLPCREFITSHNVAFVMGESEPPETRDAWHPELMRFLLSAVFEREMKKAMLALPSPQQAQSTLKGAD